MEMGGYGMSWGMDFSFFPLIFGLAFVFIIGVFLVIAIRGLGQWNKNNASPILTVDAAVVSKRMNVSRHHSDDRMNASSTSYYVTFEVESGSRMELNLKGEDYGLLAEGDRGRLTFQGTRYKGFERYY